MSFIKTNFNNIVDKLEQLQKDDNEKQRKLINEQAQKLLATLEGESNESRRLYFYCLIIDLVNNTRLRSSTLISEVIKAFLPPVINKKQLVFLTNLIGLGLTLPQPQLLNYLEHYVRNSADVIQFPSVRMSPMLARDSPIFCSVVINNGYFNNLAANKENLTTWLRCLLEASLPSNALVLNQAIRYSFLEQPTNYDLHLVILQTLQQRKCQSLNNQFLIDLATTLSRQQETITAATSPDLIDRFGQMLIICYANNLCSQSNQLKNILLEKFDHNPLIKTLEHLKTN